MWPTLNRSTLTAASWSPSGTSAGGRSTTSALCPRVPTSSASSTDPLTSFDAPDLGGFNNLIGLRIVAASAARVEARMTIDERHLQAYGIIHGGVYASIAETVA